MQLIFWCCLLFILYTYAGYPLLMAALARLRPRRVRRNVYHGSASIVLAVHDEEDKIEGRLRELLDIVNASPRRTEIIVVCDGCTDRSAERVRPFTSGDVKLVQIEEKVGKAVALSRAGTVARHDILVMADVRQRWAPDTLENLLRNFADEDVGAVSGELILENCRGVLAGVGMYWRYEKWIRRSESRCHSTVGVTGAVCAVRRELFPPLPSGIILDDVYWPLQVALRGKRVVYDTEARAFDRLPDQTRDEFRRKVRTLAGNFQLAAELPAALLPWRNPIWFQLWSHKLFRLAVPWAMLLMLFLSMSLNGLIYRQLLMLQVWGLLVAVFGLCFPPAARFRLVSAACSFLVLNAAAWWAFWMWVTGQSARSWKKSHYQPAPVSEISGHWRSSKDSRWNLPQLQAHERRMTNNE